MIRENIYESTMCSELRYIVYIDTAKRPGRLQTGIKYHSFVDKRDYKVNVTETISLEVALDQFFRLCDRMEGQGMTLVKAYN